MADTKISSLTALTSPASGDKIPIVDVSDTSQASSGTTKHITVANLRPDATTTAKGIAELATDGESAANVVVQGNDSRLSNARTPTSHATSHQNGGSDEVNVSGLSGLLADGQTPLAHNTSHQSGGGDAIKIDDLAAGDDNTDLNTSITKHGLCPKLTNNSNDYLSGTGFAKIPEVIQLAVSDEITTITTGAAKITFRMPFEMTVIAVRASLTTASSSGLVTVDINENGSSILSTKLTIDANEKTSTTAATGHVISDSTLADDAEITIDIDGAGTGAAGLKVAIIGTR